MTRILNWILNGQNAEFWQQAFWLAMQALVIVGLFLFYVQILNGG